MKEGSSDEERREFILKKMDRNGIKGRMDDGILCVIVGMKERKREI
nr:hypothetical protein [Staphylococcus saprophyticus]